MQRLSRFEIITPTSLADASTALANLGEKAAPFAGGTELILAMKLHLLNYQYLVDVKRLPRIARIELVGADLLIGAAVTHQEMALNQTVRGALPILSSVAGRIGNPRVRSTGTVGGSLCFGEPRSDLAILFSALNAGYEMRTSSSAAPRVVLSGELCPSPYEVDRRPEEVLESIRVAIPSNGWRYGYEKFQVHERPAVGVAVGLCFGADRVVSDARVSAGTGDSSPRRVAEAEHALLGPADRLLSRVRSAAVAMAGELHLVDDDEYSALYKAHLLEVLMARATETMAASTVSGV